MLAGLDPISERAIALQKAYWQSAPDELAELEARAEPSWTERLRIHQLRCLAWLDADEGRLRRALLAPPAERPSGASGSEGDSLARERVLASAKQLLGRASPFRPRHGFAWLGDGPPDGEAIPYSDFQGRTIHASLTHLGALEVVTLDDRHEPAGIEFVPFDELLTLTVAPREPGVQPAFRPARVLREYGLADQIVLLPLRHALSWYAYDPALLCGWGDAAEHEVGRIALPGLAGERSLAIQVGLQRLETLSEHAHEGLGSFRLADCYQLSLAIDEDDPRFADKCRGRGISPEATRGDVVEESRLRASARARSRGPGGPVKTTIS